MAQYDFGVINTATTTGGDLATLLQNWRDAMLSNHSGTTRPSYIKAGQIWVNTTTASAWVVNLYDGAADIPLGYVNTTDDSAGFLTRGVITTKTASATIALTERNMTVGITASTANLSMTLPAAMAAKNGFTIRFQKRDNTAFTITINRTGTDLINGAASIALAQQYDTVEMISDGSANWYAYGGLLDNSVTTPKIGNLAVTNAKIAAGAIDYSKLDAYLQSAIIPTGMITPYAGQAAPNGWLFCYGQAVSRTTFSMLFSVIGTIYGAGDGSSTFNLPDIRGRTIAGVDDMGGIRANRITNSGTVGWWLGAAGGAELHQLSWNQMPVHQHYQFANSIVYNSGANPLTGANYPALELNDGSSSPNYRIRGVPTGPSLGISGNAGNGEYHNNVQPTIIANYMIKY